MMRSAVIAGTGSSVPEKILTNKDLEDLVDTSDEWIVTRTGIRERRIAGEADRLSTYASQASSRALEMAGLPASKLDMIICATVTPDMPVPATACFIQHQLGAPRCPAFDMQAGCSGFIYALSVAKQFVINGRYENILVIGAELLSKYIDWRDRTTCVIFADGAGATLITAGEPPRGILATSIHTDGAMTDYIVIPGGGTAHPTSEGTVKERMHYIRMRGNETFKIAIRSIEEVSREVIQAAGLVPDDIHLFVPHQANLRILDAVGQRLGFDPSRVYVNIDRMGNTSAASIPIALDEAVRSGKVRTGDVSRSGVAVGRHGPSSGGAFARVPGSLRVRR
jgi:3-oxoacyl-[acyl-carrier-protein] synthase-3